jgi:tetratricopeptide (TPR) repeat protein
MRISLKPPNSKAPDSRYTTGLNGSVGQPSNESNITSAKHCPTFLILFALLFALTVPGCAFGQQTAEDFSRRGVAKEKKGDLVGAIADYSKAIDLDPKDTIAYFNRGGAKQMKGDLDGAIADYSKAIDLNPKYAIAYSNRGVAKKTKGDLDGAIADFTKAIDLDPKDPDIYQNRGNAKVAKRDLAGADADFAQAAKLAGH